MNQQAGISFFHLKNKKERIYDIKDLKPDDSINTSYSQVAQAAQSCIISHKNEHNMQLQDAEQLQWFLLFDKKDYWENSSQKTSTGLVRLNLETSRQADDFTDRLKLLTYLFKQHVTFIYDNILGAGRDVSQTGDTDQWDNSNSDMWQESQILFRSQILDLQQAYTGNLPLLVNLNVKAVCDFLYDEIEHQSFIRRTTEQVKAMNNSIDTYLDMVWNQYRLENVPLTIAESERISEALVRYQISHMDSLSHDVNYQFLQLVAGGMSMPSVDRLLNENPFTNETFIVGSKKHQSIQNAVKEFLNDIDEDNAGMNKISLKMHFKRTMTNILVSDPESSGRYTLRPNVQTHRDQAYFKILTKFNMSEDTLPMRRLIEDKQVRIYFADLVVSEFIQAGVINPKRWMPDATNRRSHFMARKALFNIGRVLGLRKHKRF